MARTPSKMIPLGTVAPPFTLLDTVTGTKRSFAELRSDRGTLVMFICNHCPFVKHIQSELIRLAKDYAGKGLAVVAISSNDPVAYPADGPEKMKEEAIRLAYPFPYLFDETQEVARSYHAACTPDFFLFNGEAQLVYRGQLDDSRPDNGIPVTGVDLRNAIDALLSGKPVPANQVPSLGCNIKWRS